MDFAALIEWSRELPPPIVWAGIGGGAFVEHVFPPFPGDTVVLVGAALVGAHGFAPLPVWAAATVGAVAGGALDFGFGRWLSHHQVERLGPTGHKALGVIVGLMQQHGAIVLAFNRFLPGVRSLFFVAAGIADLKPAAVFGWATISAVLWNSLLVAVGIACGQSTDRLLAWAEWFQPIAWTVVGLLLLRVALRILEAIRP